MEYFKRDEEWRALFALLEKNSPPPRPGLADRIIAQANRTPGRDRLSFFSRAVTLVKSALAQPLDFAPAAGLALGMTIGFFYANDASFDSGAVAYSDAIGAAAYVVDAMNDEALL